MQEITSIATGHKEHGICNSVELYKIIEQIAPEVIFEEVFQSKFSAVYDGLLGDSLETNTIKRYLQKHSIAHFPVDLETNETTEIRFRKDLNKMSYIFNDYSP